MECGKLGSRESNKRLEFRVFPPVHAVSAEGLEVAMHTEDLGFRKLCDVLGVSWATACSDSLSVV